MDIKNSSTDFRDSVTAAAKNNTSKEQNDVFWTHATIEGDRWNKAFPYQFILVKKNKDGKYEQDKDWQFTLPFPPESLQMTMPFAIAGSVTQGGYVEEHGGAPIRMINIAGTTGVLGLRPTGDRKSEPSAIQGIFAGSIQAAKAIAAQSRKISQDFTTRTGSPYLIPKRTFLQTGDTDQGELTKSSGYYQFRKLQEFFENYVSFKKTAAGKDYRLAFAVWKDQAVYLVTPMSYNVQKTAASPFEYNYSLQLKAWRRIDTSQFPPVGNSNGLIKVVASPSNLTKLVRGIHDLRILMQSVSGLLRGLGGDIANVLNILRQVAFFAKDAIAIPLSVADLGKSTLAAARNTVLDYISISNTALSVPSAFTSIKGEAERMAGAIKQAVDARSGSMLTPGDGISRITQASTATAASEARYDTHPANKIIDQPDDNYSLLSQITVGSLSLSPSVIKKIASERNEIRKLKRIDFEQMRDQLVQFQAAFTDAVGAGNTTYNETYHRTARQTTKTPTPSDFKVIFALNRTVLYLNELAVSGKIDNRLSSVDYVAGLASQSGIAFTVPKSKFAVPYPYGVTLEQLSTRYLGDPDRWIEIATLNGLRQPYVDEVGFDLPLLTNGSGNEVVVSDASKLKLGQQVWISSTTASRTARHITKINKISNSTTTLTLDGDPDLQRYTTLAISTLHAFLPDTVNSQMSIYIPSSTEPTEQNFETKEVPGLDIFDELLNVGGFDLLLTSTNDLAVTPDGDCRLAVGMQNIIQTVRLDLSIVQGRLNRHPTFGLPLAVGKSVADMTATELLSAIQGLFRDDPLFQGVTGVSVLQQGPTTTINMNVSVVGQSSLIPITLNVVR